MVSDRANQFFKLADVAVGSPSRIRYRLGEPIDIGEHAKVIKLICPGN
jgi:hypothetical protein